MVKQAAIFVGIQASGKSTFYRDRFDRTHLRINLDMLKTRHREKRLLETCLEIGQSFVVDNTNPTPEDRKRYIEPAKLQGFQIVGYFFQSTLTESIRRNQNREPEWQVPEKGIRATLKKLVVPQYAEGFDELYSARILSEGTFAVEKWAREGALPNLDVR